MKPVKPRRGYVLRHPVAFALQVLKAFQANQGLLLAGAVAYYALLSIVPLLILMVIALSQVILGLDIRAAKKAHAEFLQYE